MQSTDHLINNTRPNALLLVVDLEATCSDDGMIMPEAMETIEIGTYWISVDGTVINKFQCFVRPVLNPTLTAFCTSLTGIRQEDVDSAESFTQAANQLRRFVEQHQKPASIWLSWGV
jgi:inhibitor of KinA sporulation pathway (predicted exonuclease)